MESSRRTRAFWGEIAPSDHIVHFYEDGDYFLTVLTGFIAQGLAQNESTIIIATPEHLSALTKRLKNNGVDLSLALQEDRYITLDAQVMLSSFMVGDLPDERLFASAITCLLERASKHGRRVRAFGEMVALLWAQGNRAATIQLERLWSEFCRNYGLCLMCSYPKSGFINDLAKSVAEICAHHSRFLGDDGSWSQSAAEMARA